MTAVIHVEQARGDGLGASQAAQALGLCPDGWGSPIDLWLELTGRETRRPVAGQAARWGQILEPVVRGVYVEEHHVAVRVPEASYYHRTKPWLRATPDGIAVEEDGAALHLVQVKCPGLRAAPHWGVEERREVPVYYMIQAAVEMAVTGLDRVDFAVLLGGQEYFEVPVYRDAELEADILDGLEEFWRCVERNEAPPVDGSEGYGRYLATLLANKERRPMDASIELATTISRWREVRDELDTLEAEERLIKNQLLAAAAAAGAKQIRSPHGTVPIVESVKASRGWEGLAREYAQRLDLDGHTIDLDIERHTVRKAIAFPRAPSAWSKA